MKKYFKIYVFNNLFQNNLMVYNNKIICIPKNDSHKRFLLGQHGTRELLAIGLTPSSANEHTLDPTSRNIKTIAEL